MSSPESEDESDTGRFITGFDTKNCIDYCVFRTTLEYSNKGNSPRSPDSRLRTNSLPLTALTISTIKLTL